MVEPSLRKRYEVSQHINDPRRLFRIWDNSTHKFIIGKGKGLCETSIECDRLNDEEELYIKALTDYYNETI